MIRYDLICEFDHEFDGWFASSEVYEEQIAVGVVQCPVCGSTDVSKALMTPGVPVKQNKKPDTASSPVLSSTSGGNASQVAALMRELRKTVEDNAEYVGPRFAEEARKIHEDGPEDRSIYGEASVEEIRELTDEGIETHPLPILPEEQN